MNKEQSNQILKLLNIDDERTLKGVDKIVEETLDMIPDNVKPLLRKAQDYHRENPLSEAVLSGLTVFTEEQITSFIDVYNTANLIIDVRADHIEDLLANAAEAYVKTLTGEVLPDYETEGFASRTLH